jgi:hypothetical protein
MDWQEDKIKHYKFCYNLTMKSPIAFRLIWAICVLIGGALKEVFWDKLLKRGCCEWNDFLADLYGCNDAIFNKKSKF